MFFFEFSCSFREDRASLLSKPLALNVTACPAVSPRSKLKLNTFSLDCFDVSSLWRSFPRS